MGNPVAEGFQREPINYFDEIGVLLQLFNDQYRNHALFQVVKKENLLRKTPKEFLKIPGILFKRIGFISQIENEPIDNSGKIANTWQSDIEIHLIAPEELFVYYPAGKRYDGAELVLDLMMWIAYTILSENKQYVSDQNSDFGWDNFQIINYGYIEGGYNGVDDLYGIVMTIRFEWEAIIR